MKDIVFSITSDIVNEFAIHEEIAKILLTDLYFASPYASYERGLNKKTNDLIKQYFPKNEILEPFRIKR